jgi:hypothetical protein
VSLRPRLAPRLALCAAAAATTCVYPTEHDADVHVSVTPLPILIRGDNAAAAARAWQLLGTGDSAEITNVSFVWSSDNSAVATVDAKGHIVGIKSGTTTIRAAAANFDKRSQPGDITLRVSERLEIDSIRPPKVQFGDTITVYGVGVDSIFQAQLGQGVLIPNIFRRSRDASGYARSVYWVPPPARRDSLFYIGNGVFGFSKDTVRVIQQDLYETVFPPHDALPASIDLEGPRPFPGTAFASVLFLNPALAFEVLPRDSVVPSCGSCGVDWYRLQQTTPRDSLTIIITAPAVKGTFAGFVSDGFGGANAWTVGPGSHNCRGKKFSPKEAVGDSTIVALAGMPPASLDVVALFTQPGRYGLTVVEGYLTSDSLDARIVKDAHEEDDYCDAPGAMVTEAISPPYRAALTIDNPHDVDWIRFNVPGSLVTPVQIRTGAVPLVVGQDSSDIDVYVLHEPSAGAQLDSIAGVAAPGSDNNTTVLLAPGNYYAVVVDFAGVPTPYNICIGAGLNSCATFPAPPAPGSTAAQLQAATRRRAALEARTGALRAARLRD